MESFKDFHAKGTVKVQETEAEFYERAIKHQKIDDKRYPDLSRSGLEGPYRDLNGKIYYYDKREGKFYDPDTDIYLDAKDLRLPK